MGLTAADCCQNDTQSMCGDARLPALPWSGCCVAVKDLCSLSCNVISDYKLSLVFKCTVVGKSKWYHQVFQGSFHLKYLVVPLTFAPTVHPFGCSLVL